MTNPRSGAPTYDLRVRRRRWWIIGALALGIPAIVVSMTVWFLSGSGGEPATIYQSARAAVIAECGADPALSPFGAGSGSELNYVQWDVHVQDRYASFVWKASAGTRPAVAILRRVDQTQFIVTTCDAHIQLGG